MKTIQFIINCLATKIKKNIFNSAKNDISHDCNNLFESDKKALSMDELKCAEEYLENYKVTTRWQTL